MKKLLTALSITVAGTVLLASTAFANDACVGSKIRLNNQSNYEVDVVIDANEGTVQNKDVINFRLGQGDTQTYTVQPDTTLIDKAGGTVQLRSIGSTSTISTGEEVVSYGFKPKAGFSDDCKNTSDIYRSGRDSQVKLSLENGTINGEDAAIITIRNK